MTVWDYDGTILGTVEDGGNLTLHSYKNGRAVLFQNTGDNQSCGLYDLETGKWIVPPDKYSFVQTAADGTDTVYAAQRKDADSFDLLREDGSFLASVDQFLDFTQGRIQAVDGENIIWLDLNGEEVFRWPNQSSSY